MAKTAPSFNVIMSKTKYDTQKKMEIGSGNSSQPGRNRHTCTNLLEIAKIKIESRCLRCSLDLFMVPIRWWISMGNNDEE